MSEPHPEKTKEPVLIAMIGLVGSGKSTVAKFVASKIGAKLLSGDKIRLQLRKEGKSYDQKGQIMESEALKALKMGRSVILDSDHISSIEELEKKCLERNIKLFTLYVTCDPDIAIGRIINSRVEQFFKGASSSWIGARKGAVVKLREMWRRTPLHFNWSPEKGGKWTPNTATSDKFFHIDTTDESKWQSRALEFINLVFNK